MPFHTHAMDINALLQPRITDREALAEFAEALTDQIPDLERCIAQLRRVPRDRELIATLFRGLHTIKGDAAMCKVDVGVMITHPIEGVLSRLREGQIEFTELLAEVGYSPDEIADLIARRIAIQPTDITSRIDSAVNA